MTIVIRNQMTIVTKNIQKAGNELNRGHVIAIPTETVYGLAASIYNENAIEAIFKIKERPNNNPLIVHIKSINQLTDIATNIPESALKLANHFWPGPLTLILKKQSKISNLITAGKNTVAVRVPDHPITQELLNYIDYPIAAPSANPFGSISPTCSKHVLDYFNDKIKLILDGGNCTKGIESTIIGFENETPILFRHGALSINNIEKIVGPVKIITNDNHTPDAPGMFSRHYAPKTKAYLVDNVTEHLKSVNEKKIDILSFNNAISTHNKNIQFVLSPKGDYNEAAKNLYDYLHQLDKLNLDLILIEKLPDFNLGKSINDRLIRAVTEI